MVAFRLRRWKLAEREFRRALQGRSDRSTWLYAASVQDRLKNASRRDTYVGVANDLFPSRAYDSTLAFATSSTRPHERDVVGTYLAKNQTVLSEEAAIATSQAATPKYAFVYWDSEEQPDVVQHCIDSMRKYLPADLKLIELNAKTVGDWVQIDKRIMDRVDIPAHAADMIRLHLLAKYGGMWLDASCLLNPEFSSFYDRIRDQDFFLFTYSGSRTGNWFIWARPESYRLQLLRTALDRWFTNGGKWTNYFMFHDVVEMLYWTDDRYRHEWDAGLSLAPTNAFDCHKALGRSVTDEEWSAVRQRSPINKLSWRKYNAPELRADPTTGVSRLMAEVLD
jgi:hypothetical protein